MPTRHRLALAVTTALLGLSASATAPSAPPADDTWNEVRATLATLDVKGRAPKTGYARAEFGQTWTDDVEVEGGHNGCDTRII